MKRKTLIIEIKVKLLLRQARYDQPERFEVKFADVWVLGNKLFLTEEAVKGFPNPKRRLIERVQIEDAIAYAKELKDRYTVLWLYYDLFGIKE